MTGTGNKVISGPMQTGKANSSESINPAHMLLRHVQVFILWKHFKKLSTSIFPLEQSKANYNIVQQGKMRILSCKKITMGMTSLKNLDK